MTAYITNQHGIKFYIENAMDWSEDGALVASNGVFAGLVCDGAELSGEWFHSRDAAMVAIQAWAG